jgi:hypothetical protein
MKLKLALVASGKCQRRIAAETQRVTENRLSEIVNGWIEPRDDEKGAIARVLDQPIDLLFDEPELQQQHDDPPRPAA